MLGNRMPGHLTKSFLVCFMLGFLGVTTIANGQGIALQDDFETPPLSSIWTTKKLSDGALRFISHPTRSGKSAIEITLRPGANTAGGGDGQVTEREEIREAPEVRLCIGVESWYAFSFYLPTDFPITDTRLVIARWKQSFADPAKDRSPMVALRYMGGRLMITIARDRGKRKLYKETIDLRGQWVDMVFRIVPKPGPEGLLQVWQNHRQVVDYHGPLGFKDDQNETYFKLGLYRDQMKSPIRIVYDRFRRGDSYEAVRLPLE